MKTTSHGRPEETWMPIARAESDAPHWFDKLATLAEEGAETDLKFVPAGQKRRVILRRK
jgi:hypothetical protein